MRAAEGAIEAGTVLVSKYRIESVLGRGGMGMVYRARHLALGDDVAIKVLRRDVSLDEETVMRFMREAQSAVKLKSEHVARIQDVGACEDGLPFMVMEFLQGADLGQMVDTHGAMSIPVAVDLVLQACDAIVEAHSLGIVHRDVKPSNLFVSFRPDQSAIVKVLDFGISKSANGSDMHLTQTQSMLGTPAYMSPEQMRSARSVDARTDIWSLGTVLYELVEGRRPFEAESFSEMCVMVAVDAPARMTMAAHLEPVIARCLAKKPDDRYPHVAELMRELAPFAGNYDAANHYVKRAYRTLGLGVPTRLESSPSVTRGSYPAIPVGPTPSAVHGAANAAMAGAMPNPTEMPMASPVSATTLQDPVPPAHRGGGRWFAVVGICALIGVLGTIALVKVSDGDGQTSSTGDRGDHGVKGTSTGGAASGTTGTNGATAKVGATAANAGAAETGSATANGGETGNGKAGSDTGNAAANGGETGNGKAGIETGNGSETSNGKVSSETGNGKVGSETGNGKVSGETGNGKAGGETGNGKAGGETGNGKVGSGEKPGGSGALATVKPPGTKPPGTKPLGTKPPVVKPPVVKPPIVKPPVIVPAGTTPEVKPPVAKPCGGGDPFAAPRPCKT